MFHPFCRLQASYLARGTQKSQQKIWILKTWESLFSCGFDMMAMSPNLNKNSNFWDLKGGIPPLKTTATWIKLSFFLNCFGYFLKKKMTPLKNITMILRPSTFRSFNFRPVKPPSEDVSEKCCGPGFGCDSAPSIRMRFGTDRIRIHRLSWSINLQPVSWLSLLDSGVLN